MDWLNDLEDCERRADRVLQGLRDAGYFVGCADCNSSTNGIHYVGCQKIAPASSASPVLADSAPNQP